VSHQLYATMKRDDRRKSGLEYLGIYTNTPPRFHMAKPNGNGKKRINGETKKDLGKTMQKKDNAPNNQLKRSQKMKDKKKLSKGTRSTT
jgi:hypothetical protein